MNILNINSSSNKTTSTSSSYAKKIVGKLTDLHPNATVVERHTTYSDIPFINQEILGALFVKGERTEEQKRALELSNTLVEELIAADTIVISSPIYNFSVPASLKAYFDLVARAGLTFRYTYKGPKGLLTDKKAYIVISSGGTAIKSDIDFAGNYIQHFLKFLGITDIEFVELDQLMFKSEEKLEQANKQLEMIA
jgi:FMN-dependent NADH-azoreductase